MSAVVYVHPAIWERHQLAEAMAKVDDIQLATGLVAWNQGGPHTYLVTPGEYIALSTGIISVPRGVCA